DEHVVADAAPLVGDQAVADLPVLHGGRVVGVDRLDQVEAAGAGEGQPAHVRDVEQPGGGAHRLVLGDDAGVLHRHLPAGELDHAGAAADVPVVQRGAQGVHV